MDDKLKDNLKYVAIIFLIIGAAVAGLGLDMEWCKVDAKGAHYGPIDLNLTAEFNSYGVDYEGEAGLNRSRAPSLLGLAGGLTPDTTIEIEDEKTFLTGMGDFQENIGVFYDSTKTVTYERSASHWNGSEYNEITVEITTNVDMIPWWVEGMAQPCEVTVKLIEIDENVQVTIERVWIELQLDWDKDNREYTRTKTLWEKNVNDNLFAVNDTKKYKTDVTLNKDYGRVGIVGKAEVKIVDLTTDESIQPIERKPLTINIYTLSQSEGIDIVLIISAFPLAIISIILCILAVILIFAKKRAGAYLGIAAFIIMILVVIFYFRGMETLLNQISIVEEYFSWSYGIIVTGVGAGFMAAGSVIAFIVRPPKVPKGGKADKKSDEIQFVITEDEVDEKDIKDVKKVSKRKNKGIKPKKSNIGKGEKGKGKRNR
jgi:hypothetical protein